MTRSDRKVLQDLKREVIETAKTIFEENLAKLTFGVVSAGIPSTDHAVITPSDSARQEKLHNIPLGRFATPDDIANVVVLLVSDESRHVSGEFIKITGGK